MFGVVRCAVCTCLLCLKVCSRQFSYFSAKSKKIKFENMLHQCKINRRKNWQISVLRWFVVNFTNWRNVPLKYPSIAHQSTCSDYLLIVAWITACCTDRSPLILFQVASPLSENWERNSLALYQSTRLQTTRKTNQYSFSYSPFMNFYLKYFILNVFAPSGYR
jgi:hypothetical protein